MDIATEMVLMCPYSPEFPYVYLRFQGASASQVIGARNEMIMDDNDGEMMFGDLGA